jgi:hypothetical protein
MSTQAHTDFWELRNIITLAAVAAEARRVLDDIEVISRGVPEFNESLSKLIDARRQWMTFDDTLPDVINSVAIRLEELAKTES